ncbi:hypothetical protein [Xanthomonas vesicatoria]|nr:hypothetical protein [Xanthomonas vesicatoria]MCC8616824.1 hypothetical protein [Xanthomonas vesicatoria]MCC8630618.1 hypothetical protein [Xanthomonas vesicatoria]
MIKHALPLDFRLWHLSDPIGVALQVGALPELQKLRYRFEGGLKTHCGC